MKQISRVEVVSLTDAIEFIERSRRLPASKRESLLSRFCKDTGFDRVHLNRIAKLYLMDGQDAGN